MSEEQKMRFNGIYLNHSQEELDRAYDQRVWASDMGAILSSCANLSAAVRKNCNYQADVCYGAGNDETFDWFPAEHAGSAVHIHLHGGAWRAQSKHDVSFIAPAFTSQGVNFVAPNFTNLPTARLPDMVDQLCRMVAFVYRRASQLGGDPGRIFISGHSSGAHLCAVLITHDWTRNSLPRDVLKGGLCISGSYDLEPVILSARRLYIDLTPDEVRQFSPIRHVENLTCPVDIVYGGRESPEFIRQAQTFAEVLSPLHRGVTVEAFPELNHFQMAVQFGRSGSAIHGKAMKQIEPT